MTAFIQSLRQAFDQYLADQQLVHAPKELYEPIEYVMNLGGKRIRPILTLLSCSLFEVDFRKALPAAFAVEVFHNFSLVHDDIMDESPLRRGQPAVHMRYNVNTGILSGDLMLIIAYQYINNTAEKSIIPNLLHVFTQVATKVCQGQQYDMNFEALEAVSVEEYLKMIELKTAVLLAGALEMGAITAGAGEVDRRHLSEFGRLTGIAFQLQDDYLDVFGDPETIGKRAGNDIVRNKKTLLYLKALERAEPAQKQQLAAWYADQPADPTAKIEAVTELMKRLDVPEFVTQLRDTYQANAYEHLDLVNAPPERKEPLKGLAESLLKRAF